MDFLGSQFGRSGRDEYFGNGNKIIGSLLRDHLVAWASCRSCNAKSKNGHTGFMQWQGPINHKPPCFLWVKHPLEYVAQYEVICIGSSRIDKPCEHTVRESGSARGLFNHLDLMSECILVDAFVYNERDS